MSNSRSIVAARPKAITSSSIAGLVGPIPYRLALAGGWIDQPFVSEHNPKPPGSMVVVSIEPTFRFMDRSGICSSTREAARVLWPGGIPVSIEPTKLVRQLYEAENRDRGEPSGSQDMIGLIYPGISRLDYDAAFEGGIFPKRIETLTDATSVAWLERVLHILPVAQRPDGYNPLGAKKLSPEWIARLGQTGRDCFEAIRARDAEALGSSFNECMKCWEAILPQTVRHPALTVDLPTILEYYQSRHPGAMYSGCGGGYLFVVSEEPVAGAFNAEIRPAAP
jgi:hypothetical protein